MAEVHQPRSTTTKWGYVISAQFPYSQWMSWNMYNTEGIPQLTFNRTAIKPDPGSVNPFETGVPVLAPKRSYHLYLMPAQHAWHRDRTMRARYRRGERGGAAGPR